MELDNTPRSFVARSPARLTLPRGAAEAEAALAAFIRGDAEFLPREGLEAQRKRIEALRDPLAPDSLDELTRQLPTLEALWQRFAAESVARQASPEQRFKYLKAALHAQQAFARTFALLCTLRQQRGAKASITLHDDEGPDNDSD